MTNRERFYNAMHYLPVDHPPYFLDGPWPDTLERWYGEGYPRGVALEDYLGVEPFRYHGAGIDTFFIPPLEPRILEETEEFVIRTDAYGATLKDFRDHTSMPHWIDFPVKTPADLEERIELLRWNGGAGRIPADWDAQVAAWRADGLGVVASGGSYYGILRNLMSVELLSTMLYDAPESIKRYNDAYFELIMRILERVFADLPGEVLYVSFGEDFAYKTAPLLSPAMYRKFIMPYHQAVVDLARSHGVDIFFFDSDGNLNLMLPHLLEAGINLFYPIECAADMDPLALRATYGRDLRMIGGIDKRALAAGKPAIRAELERKVPPLIAEGGYLPRVDHSVGTDISLENFRYYMQVLLELFGMEPAGALAADS
ncbi:MAG TPA: uroporphyrinogen decarboxylase family protein [Armatimonadota bacterium]